jgi:hypothetical protein
MIPIRHRVSALVIAAALTALAPGCASLRPARRVAPPAARAPIMAPSRLSAAQLVAWFNGRQPRPRGLYRATVPVDELAQLYIQEGAAEGVTGDVAFMQGVVETAWFRFSGMVPAAKNNFAGIGATGANPEAAAFPDARTGVRAQIQHLRAYADHRAYACSAPPLINACVDPRFALVVPKGRAPTWNQMGGGNWASAATYAASILTLYDEARAFNGVRGIRVPNPEPRIPNPEY